LLGKPLYPNYTMSSAPTAATTSLIFGDLSKILIVDFAGGIRIKRATERWADQDSQGIAGYLRTQAGLLDGGGKPIQALVQHS
jgi:HK97 family phage major capsid protein